MPLATNLRLRTACAAGALLVGALVLSASPSAQDAEASPPDPADEHVARVIEAFEEGDCDALLDLTARRVEIVLLGQGARYSRGQASLILRDFFRRYPPDRVLLSERSTTGDGRAAMGRYWSGNSSAPFSLYVGFRVDPDG
ncbi:MAG TPA: DUF4783 domain-containing protein, partial [Anaeromyxobacteraceae bacterium]|nr:DUF4783 domain-containing protein [Anaeromyxobacteraceae bacterium]